MNRMISSVLSASALIFAQTAKVLVGMLTLVSVTLEHDGKKTDVYGTNPQGQAKRLFKLPVPRLPVEHARVAQGRVIPGSCLLAVSRRMAVRIKESFCNAIRPRCHLVSVV